MDNSKNKLKKNINYQTIVADSDYNSNVKTQNKNYYTHYDQKNDNQQFNMSQDLEFLDPSDEE